MNLAKTLLLSTAAVAALTTGALAADYSAPPAYTPTTPYAPASSAFSFEGFYVGILGGGLWDSTGGTYLTAPDTGAWNLGAAAGVNFYLTDSILGGFEVQGGANFGASGTTYDALALGRLGFAPSNEVLVYGTGGVGSVGGTGVYALGGGVEVAAWDNVSVRGEALALGPWGGSPDAAKATVGLIWHMP